jgi:cytidylate kinase
MRNWELSRAQRVPARPEDEQPEVADFIAISRTIGSGGSLVALALGERLGWPVYDREILQLMAGDDDVRKRLYEHMDERDTSWLDDAVRWVMQGEFRRDDYFYRLSETVLALARRQKAIFLGRGADAILPRDRGLRVRVTAQLEKRAAALTQRRGLSPEQARAEAERIDREREDFRRNHFGKDALDPSAFDLGLSLDQFSVEDAVELILAAMQRRGMHP